MSENSLLKSSLTSYVCDFVDEPVPLDVWESVVVLVEELDDVEDLVFVAVPVDDAVELPVETLVDLKKKGTHENIAKSTSSK